MKKRDWLIVLATVGIGGYFLFKSRAGAEEPVPEEPPEIPPETFKVIVTGTPSTGYAPLTVNFEVNTEGITGIDHVVWGFGDGDISYYRNPSHTYTGTGTFNVLCRVWATDGRDSLGSMSVSVFEAGSPTELRIGDRVLRIAHPLGLWGEATGTVSDISTDQYGTTFYTMTVDNTGLLFTNTIDWFRLI